MGWSVVATVMLGPEVIPVADVGLDSAGWTAEEDGTALGIGVTTVT